MLWDSPLSALGVDQAKKLLAWLDDNSSSNKHAALLSGKVHCDTPDSVVVLTSNLRRSISTSFIALAQRLRRHPYESVYCCSALQEITRNVDGYPLSTRSQAPRVSWAEQDDQSLGHVVE